MRIECDKVIVARALQVADHTVMTVAIQMDAVHIGGDGVSVIEVENNILDGEVGADVNHHAIIGRVLEGKVRDTETAYVIEEHRVSEVAILPEISGVDGIRALIPIVEVPDTALDFEIVTGVLRIGGQKVHEAPEALRFLTKK